MQRDNQLQLAGYPISHPGGKCDLQHDSTLSIRRGQA
jgi:hypothetical protein